MRAIDVEVCKKYTKLRCKVPESLGSCALNRILNPKPQTKLRCKVSQSFRSLASTPVPKHPEHTSNPKQASKRTRCPRRSCASTGKSQSSRQHGARAPSTPSVCSEPRTCSNREGTSKTGRMPRSITSPASRASRRWILAQVIAMRAVAYSKPR